MKKKWQQVNHLLFQSAQWINIIKTKRQKKKHIALEPLCPRLSYVKAMELVSAFTCGTISDLCAFTPGPNLGQVWD